MKHFLFLVLLCLFTLYVKAQDYKYPVEIEEYIEEEDTTGWKAPVPPNYLFSTDSVYNFLHSLTYALLEEENVSVIQDAPIPYDIVKEKIRHSGIQSFIDEPCRTEKCGEEESISFSLVHELLTAAIDSTTTYTPPISKWNISRLGKEWITESNYFFLRELTSQRMQYRRFPPPHVKITKKMRKRMDKEWEKRYEEYSELFWPAMNYDFIKMSVPVFDSNYTYAFLLFDRNGAYSFAIFKREKDRWELVYNLPPTPCIEEESDTL